jgi:hypothetical protein
LKGIRIENGVVWGLGIGKGREWGNGKKGM